MDKKTAIECSNSGTPIYYCGNTLPSFSNIPCWILEINDHGIIARITKKKESHAGEDTVWVFVKDLRLDP